MPQMSIKELPNLNSSNVHNLLNMNKEAEAIALHEAAHTVAAVAYGVHISRIWVKSTFGCGKSILTQGRDGCVITLPNDAHQECFISLVGFAWEERFGNPHSALNDVKKYNLSRPWVRDDADQFVSYEYITIHLCAAAILGLRTKQGLLETGRLAAMCQWLRPKVRPLKSYYEQGVLAPHEPW